MEILQFIWPFCVIPVICACAEAVFFALFGPREKHILFLSVIVNLAVNEGLSLLFLIFQLFGVPADSRIPAYYVILGILELLCFYIDYRIFSYFLEKPGARLFLTVFAANAVSFLAVWGMGAYLGVLPFQILR